MRSQRSLIGMLAILLCALISGPAHAQGMDSVEIRTIPVAKGIAMLVGQGGNICVSTGSDGVFMIDDQYAPLTEKIKKAVSVISSEPIRFVINTHWHGDHVGGNENLGKEGVAIVAHENVRARLSVDQTAWERKVPALKPIGLPVITFTRDLSFHLNGVKADVFHVANAHTDGDSVIHFRDANVIHTGDVVFMGTYPYIDIEHGGSINGMIDAVSGILSRIDDETRVIPGHGPLTDRAGLMTYRTMLLEIRDRIQVEVDAGKRLREIVLAKPSRDYDAQWGNGWINPDALVTTIYQSLTGSTTDR